MITAMVGTMSALKEWANSLTDANVSLVAEVEAWKQDNLITQASRSCIEKAINDYDSGAERYVVSEETRSVPDKNPLVRGLGFWYELASYPITICPLVRRIR